MAAIADTNVLVYVYDPRDLAKQRLAIDTLYRSLEFGSIVLTHQTIIEMVAASTRPAPFPGGRRPILPVVEAHRRAEELMQTFPVLYPTEDVVRAALRGMSSYQLSWYDAHLWAYAECYGIPEILSEDFEHGRYYGAVRVTNPFLETAEEINERQTPWGA